MKSLAIRAMSCTDADYKLIMDHVKKLHGKIKKDNPDIDIGIEAVKSSVTMSALRFYLSDGKHIV